MATANTTTAPCATTEGRRLLSEIAAEISDLTRTMRGSIIKPHQVADIDDHSAALRALCARIDRLTELIVAVVDDDEPGVIQRVAKEFREASHG